MCAFSRPKYLCNVLRTHITLSAPRHEGGTQSVFGDFVEDTSYRATSLVILTAYRRKTNKNVYYSSPPTFALLSTARYMTRFTTINPSNYQSSLAHLPTGRHCHFSTSLIAVSQYNKHPPHPPIYVTTAQTPDRRCL